MPWQSIESKKFQKFQVLGSPSLQLESSLATSHWAVCQPASLQEYLWGPGPVSAQYTSGRIFGVPTGGSKPAFIYSWPSQNAMASASASARYIWLFNECDHLLCLILRIQLLAMEMLDTPTYSHYLGSNNLLEAKVMERRLMWLTI